MFDRVYALQKIVSNRKEEFYSYKEYLFQGPMQWPQKWRLFFIGKNNINYGNTCDIMGAKNWHISSCRLFVDCNLQAIDDKSIICDLNHCVGSCCMVGSIIF